jgi:lysophospholipase L1-like esterase
MQKSRLTILLLTFCFISSNSISAQDWANLKVFKDRNSTLEAPKVNESRVVFMGNSITQAWSRISPEFMNNPLHINRGISGQTTPQMLVRFRADVVALQPKAVIILAGTNDIAGNKGPSTLEMISDNIQSMAEIADANGIKVILASVLPAYDYPWKPGLEPAEKIVKLNAMIKSYCEAKGHVYLDFFSAMADNRNGLKADLGKDGVHPNKKGYDIMEPLALEAIKKAINK